MQKSYLGNPFLWGSAGLISIALLVAVMAQVDFAHARDMLENMSWPLLIAAFALLWVEGIITALRIWLFAGRKASKLSALQANAWYVVLLIMLPARLGEVAAVLVFERYLKQKYGAAAMSIVTQRLYDVIVLGTLFLIALMGVNDVMDAHVFVVVAVVLIGFAVFVLARMDMFLTLGAVILRRLIKGRRGIVRKLMHLVLQARIYARHGLRGRDIPLVLFLSIVKWCASMGAIILLLASFHLGLDFFEMAAVATSYNFLAVVPLQTIGGIGLGEAALTILLSTMGVPVAVAAGASLMVRFVILIFPFMFCAGVTGGLKLKEKFCHD